jgi:hypothetical protein
MRGRMGGMPSDYRSQLLDILRWGTLLASPIVLIPIMFWGRENPQGAKTALWCLAVAVFIGGVTSAVVRTYRDRPKD